MTREDVIKAMERLGGKDIRVLDILDVLYPPGWWNYLCRVVNGGNVYSKLFVMEEKGIVTSRWQEVSQERHQIDSYSQPRADPLWWWNAPTRTATDTPERGKYRRRLYTLVKPTAAA